MRLTLADKLAILYTASGSQREVARRVGLTHQQVGRVLHAQARGLPEPKILGLDESLIRQALKDQAKIAAKIARDESIPEIKGLPIIARRIVLKNQAVKDTRTGEHVFIGSETEVKRYLRGQRVIKRDAFGDITKIIAPDQTKLSRYERIALLGDRVTVKNMHWLSDNLRTELLSKLVETKQYHSASIGSVVKLSKYITRAQNDEKKPGYIKTLDQIRHRNKLKADKKAGIDYKLIFTQKRTMQGGWTGEEISASFDIDLDRKHASATNLDDPQTKFADQIILQLDPDRENALSQQLRKQRSPRNKARNRSKK